tara:strand:+ start:437 stop:568 length:132 start_codon:yes stop_codon:yes gene_type:complete
MNEGFEVILALVLYMTGIVTGMYAASQVEKYIDKKTNNNKNKK